MDWKEIHHRLVEGLRVELSNSWGRVAEVEKRLGCSDGYLRKLCTGRNGFKLGFFLRSIEALGLDARAFFSRTLAVQTSTDDFLEQLEDPQERDPAFTSMARVTLDLESSEPPPPHPAAVADASEVEKLACCARNEQLRRLRQTARYRTHAFARAYLEHLDSLRYDDAVKAAHLARGAAVYLIPALPGPPSDRLSYQCLVLGIFGSARRLKGDFTVAARAFRLALEVSRRARLREDTASLLIRASYLLKDFGQFERALSLLREALEIYIDLGSKSGVARTMVDRGMMLTGLGDYEAAVVVLERALQLLDGASENLPRYQLAAYQYLAYAHEQSGDVDSAESWLAKGVGVLGSLHAVDCAKLEWSYGTLAFKRGDYRKSEVLLASARKVLAKHENVLQEAVVTLDLLGSLLAQGKSQESNLLATSLPQFLRRFKNNHFAEAAIVELVSSALAGTLSIETVREARASLARERPMRDAASAITRPVRSTAQPRMGRARAPQRGQNAGPISARG